MAAMTTEKVNVSLVTGGIGPAHAQRYVDRAIYQMMIDAVSGNTDLRVNPKKIFRPDEDLPVVDDFIMDEVVVLMILDKLRQQDPV